MNLPQAPGQLRNYTVYVETSLNLSATSDTFHVSDNDDGVQTLNSSGLFSSATPSGANWYEIGTVQLASGDASSMMTVSYTGSVAIAQAWRGSSRPRPRPNDADGNLVAESDGLGNSTTYVYNTLGLPAQQPDPSNMRHPAGAVVRQGGQRSDQYRPYGQRHGLSVQRPGPDRGDHAAGAGERQPQPVTTDSSTPTAIY